MFFYMKQASFLTTLYKLLQILLQATLTAWVLVWSGGGDFQHSLSRWYGMFGIERGKTDREEWVKRFLNPSHTLPQRKGKDNNKEREEFDKHTGKFARRWQKDERRRCNLDGTLKLFQLTHLLEFFHGGTNFV